jgi:hypothetical protein
MMGVAEPARRPTEARLFSADRRRCRGHEQRLALFVARRALASRARVPAHAGHDLREVTATVVSSRACARQLSRAVSPSSAGAW